MNRPSPKKVLKETYLWLNSDYEGRLCRDIPESACNKQPQHFFQHLTAMTLNKLADGLLDTKLILTWILTLLGASSVLIGWVVPIREAGALLPQLFHAEWIRRRSQRKWVWVMGAITQGLSVLIMVMALLFFDGRIASLIIIAALALLAIARSFCSVSYKDVLAKTISKSRRGTVTGLATSLSAFLLLIFALAVVLDIITLELKQLTIVLLIAGLSWLVAGFAFSLLKELKGSTEGGINPIAGLAKRVMSALGDKQLLIFLTVRALLTATAFAPPFMLLLSQQAEAAPLIHSHTESQISNAPIGLLLLASAMASLLSGYLWGRLADRSSRTVLFLASLIGATSFSFVLLLNHLALQVLYHPITIPTLLFILLIAHQGVRLGRSTHLTDMADDQSRANYTAVGNALIGIVLLLGSGFGWIVQHLGLIYVFVGFLVMTVIAAWLTSKLDEVQAES